MVPSFPFPVVRIGEETVVIAKRLMVMGECYFHLFGRNGPVVIIHQHYLTEIGAILNVYDFYCLGLLIAPPMQSVAANCPR